MRFFYETFPIFLCGLASGIVLMAVVGWLSKGGADQTKVSRWKHSIVKKKTKHDGLQHPLLPHGESDKTSKRFAWIKMKRYESK